MAVRSPDPGRQPGVTSHRIPAATDRPRVLVFAYACEPGRGSEPGVGWSLVQSVARFADPVVLVGPEHIEAIRAWETSNPDSPLEFELVDEPKWARRLPHEPTEKSRRHLIGYFVTYLGWQRRAARAARSLHAQQPFDVAHHATYSVYWLPSPGRRLDIPLVWGPVGGAVTTPFAMWRSLGATGILSELVDLVAVRFLSLARSTRQHLAPGPRPDPAERGDAAPGWPTLDRRTCSSIT